jgi:L-alanine-DL-glutamate epimerase-like enolase superfamily enzyme
VPKPTDIRLCEVELFFLPYEHRVPLKFGDQTVSQVTAARVRVRVEDRRGNSAEGWGETPLSVAWVWPSKRTWRERESAMKRLCIRLVTELQGFDQGFTGHPLELGSNFIQQALVTARHEINLLLGRSDPLPELAALACLSPFDLAIYDAFGNLHQRPVFDTLDEDLLSTDLAHFFDGDTRFTGQFPAQYLRRKINPIAVWHLVGGLDPLEPADLAGDEPQDGHPLLLRDWIRQDGLKCLKIKLRGNDSNWDYERLVRIGEIAIAEGCDWLTADFNCTVTNPAYVCQILDRLLVEHPRIYGMTLYIEQPFPYDLKAHQLDVREVSARKPLFLDESAHDWRCVRLGRELGWTGVALKTCKTLTGALLSLCWARANGMTLMVQDLTNTMLAQIPHVTLAAHAGTIMGVESNGMQFAPAASAPEAKIHPGLYRRRAGLLDLATLGPHGFGYRVSEIARALPSSTTAAV